jgi:hypothetical protein
MSSKKKGYSIIEGMIRQTMDIPIEKDNNMEEKEDEKTELLPGFKSQFDVGVHEEVGGFIRIEAEDQDEAHDKVSELVREYGLIDLFHTNDPELIKVLKEAGVVFGKHVHGDTEILTVEEV